MQMARGVVEMQIRAEFLFTTPYNETDRYNAFFWNGSVVFLFVVRCISLVTSSLFLYPVLFIPVYHRQCGNILKT